MGDTLYGQAVCKNSARMHAYCKTQMVLAADIRIGDGIVGMWFRGGYDECEPTSKHSVRDFEYTFRDYKHSVRDYRHSVRDYKYCAEPYGGFVAQSKGHCPGSISNAGLEFDEYHGLHRLRCLERTGGNERFAIDWTTQGNGTVYVDVHWSRRQCRPIGYDHRQRGCAYRHDQLKPKQRVERRIFNA